MFVATVIVSAFLALAVAASAAGKLSRVPQVVDMLTGLGVPASWRPRLAAAELAGGVGIAVGLAIAPLGVAAAAGLVCYFLGAVITHLRVHDRQIAAPIVLAALAAAAANKKARN